MPSCAGASPVAPCAIFSAAVAVLHLVAIYYGAPAYRYFGAGEELASMAEAGSAIPGLVTFGIAVLFLVLAAYALAAAGALRLPFASAGAAAIGAL